MTAPKDRRGLAAGPVTRSINRRIPKGPTPRYAMREIRLETGCVDTGEDLFGGWHEPIVVWAETRHDLDALGRRNTSGVGWSDWIKVVCNNPSCAGLAWMNRAPLEHVAVDHLLHVR